MNDTANRVRFGDFELRRDFSERYCRIEIWNNDGVIWEPCMRISLQCGSETTRKFVDGIQKLYDIQSQDMDVEVDITRGATPEGEPDEIWPPAWVEKARLTIHKVGGEYNLELGNCTGASISVDGFVNVAGVLLRWLARCRD